VDNIGLSGGRIRPVQGTSLVLGILKDNKNIPMAKATKTLKKQTFRYVDSEAQKVLLVGDFTEWQKAPISMKSVGNGLWTATVNLGPGSHSYLFVVDGEWCEDPDCSLRIPNPYGGVNMVRQVV
jgi:1,4-alpha-glucan branching enzyme